MSKILISFLSILVFVAGISAQTSRVLSGVVVTPQFELVPYVSIEVVTANGKINTVTSAEGAFSVEIPPGPVSVKYWGRNLPAVEQNFTAWDRTDDLQLKNASRNGSISIFLSITF